MTDHMSETGVQAGIDAVYLWADGDARQIAESVIKAYLATLEAPALAELSVGSDRTTVELKMTSFADAAPQRDELNGEQTILTYTDRVGTWDLAFFEAGEDFPERWLGDTHWIDITRMWPGVIAQVASFETKPPEDISVGVKPLEWIENQSWKHAKTPFGAIYTARPCLATNFLGKWLLSLEIERIGPLHDSEDAAKAAAQADYEARIRAALTATADTQNPLSSTNSEIGETTPADPATNYCKFALGDRVRKTKGSSWQGRIVGFYSTELTPIGYAVESEREPGSVQIYPETALAALSSPMEGGE